jgi:hypothetical protein
MSTSINQLGITFPDGTTQTTAANNVAGAIGSYCYAVSYGHTTSGGTLGTGDIVNGNVLYSQSISSDSLTTIGATGSWQWKGFYYELTQGLALWQRIA